VLHKPFNLRQIFDWLDTVVQARRRESGNG